MRADVAVLTGLARRSVAPFGVVVASVVAVLGLGCTGLRSEGLDGGAGRTGGAGGRAGSGGAARGGASGTGVGGRAGAAGNVAGAAGTAAAGAGGNAVAGMGGSAVAGSGGATTCTASGDCPGTCQTCSPTTHTCGPAKNVDDPNGRCAGTCDAGGACKSKKGQLCNATAGNCIDGTSCAPDGYCCDRACTGSCEACDLTGLQGTCTAVSGAIHSNHTPCAGGSTVCAGSCMGRSDGTCVYPTVECGNATCSGTSIVDPSKCSAGACVPPQPRACVNNLACAGNVCKTSCSADADCTGGTFCHSGACRRPAVAITAGYAHTCALLADGSVQCWGSNTDGALGRGTVSTTEPFAYANPAPVSGLGGNVTAIAAQFFGTCALLGDATVRCWGRNAFGELGNGTITSGNTQGIGAPGTVTGLGRPVTAISAGGGFACALLNDNTLWCWGDDGYGQLGDGMARTEFGATGSPVPVKVLGLSALSTIAGVAGGAFHTCAIGTNGNIFCWGINDRGSLGRGTATDFEVTPSGVSLTQAAIGLTSGYEHSCMVVSGGGVRCWGQNYYGEVGTGTFSTTQPLGILSPASVTGGLLASKIAAGPAAYHTCAVTAAGAVYCWGSNYGGELGDGSINTSTMPFGKATPVMVVGLPGQASAVASGGFHSCALMKNGSVWCWGTNTDGQLGNGFTTSATAIQVSPW